MPADTPDRRIGVVMAALDEFHVLAGRVTQTQAAHVLAKLDALSASPVGEGALQPQAASVPTEQAGGPVVGVLADLLAHVDQETCRHEDTHRGGTIWTICDDCGRKWADDEGGFKPYADAPAVAAARAFLSAPSTTSTAEQVGTAKKPFDFECQHGWMACGMCDADPASPFQGRVKPWMLVCFGAEIAADTLERNDRFIEEALELVQSLGYSADRAHALVDYVFGRPVGEPRQEVGGVMVTLAALCLAAGLDMHEAGEAELARITRPEIIEKIRAKQAAKPTGSALPIAPSPGEGDAPVAWRWKMLGQWKYTNRPAEVEMERSLGEKPEPLYTRPASAVQFGALGDYTPTEAMVEAGREFMPRNVSEENVVRAFMEMMKQAEIDGLVPSPVTRPTPATPEGLREKVAQEVVRIANGALAGAGLPCRVASTHEPPVQEATDRILSALQPQGGEG